jgi:hypothetical protein
VQDRVGGGARDVGSQARGPAAFVPGGAASPQHARTRSHGAPRRRGKTPGETGRCGAPRRSPPARWQTLGRSARARRPNRVRPPPRDQRSRGCPVRPSYRRGSAERTNPPAFPRLAAARRSPPDSPP